MTCPDDPQGSKCVLHSNDRQITEVEDTKYYIDFQEYIDGEESFEYGYAGAMVPGNSALKLQPITKELMFVCEMEEYC